MGEGRRRELASGIGGVPALHARISERPQSSTSSRFPLRRYSLSERGERVLKAWLSAGQVEFPVLKHEVVLRLFLGHLTGPDRPLQVLDAYRLQLNGRIEELRAIRGRLGTDPHFQYPAMVAEWGIRLYQEELASVEQVGSALVEADS